MQSKSRKNFQTISLVQNVYIPLSHTGDPAFLHNWWACIVGSSYTHIIQVPFRKLFSILVPCTFYAIHSNRNWTRTNCCAQRCVCVRVCAVNNVLLSRDCAVWQQWMKRKVPNENHRQNRNQWNGQKEKLSPRHFRWFTLMQRHTYLNGSHGYHNKNSPVEWQSIVCFVFYFFSHLLRFNIFFFRHSRRFIRKNKNTTNREIPEIGSFWNIFHSIFPRALHTAHTHT